MYNKIYFYVHMCTHICVFVCRCVVFRLPHGARKLWQNFVSKKEWNMYGKHAAGWKGITLWSLCTIMGMDTRFNKCNHWNQ